MSRNFDDDNVAGVSESKGCHCDSRSACALKDIIDNLDDLNNQDLRTLDNLIDRLLCCRS